MLVGMAPATKKKPAAKKPAAKRADEKPAVKRSATKQVANKPAAAKVAFRSGPCIRDRAGARRRYLWLTLLPLSGGRTGRIGTSRSRVQRSRRETSTALACARG